MPQAVANRQRPAERRTESTKVLEAAARRLPPRQAALFASFEAAGVQPPPQAADLIRLEAGGASREELLDFVRTQFPKDARTRLCAAAWANQIRSAEGTGTDTSAIGRGTLKKPLGVIKKTGGSP
jgi:hypothetical protein